MTSLSELHSSSSNTPKQRKYQDECFTPKKALARSPPSVTPLLTPAGKENSLPSNDSRAEATSEQPKSVSSVNKSLAAPKPSKVAASSSSKTRSQHRDTQAGHAGERKVQDVCFTPIKSLQRTPPLTKQSEEVSPDLLMDAVPPASHWALPRTPTVQPTATRVTLTGPVTPPTSNLETVSNGSAFAPTESTVIASNPAPPYASATSSETTPISIEAPPTTHWELPRTPATHVLTDRTREQHEVKSIVESKSVSSKSHEQMEKSGVTDVSIVSPSNCQDLTPSDAGAAPPTKSWELPRTPNPGPVLSNSNHPLPTRSNELANASKAPPTSGWELPRTPPISSVALSKSTVSGQEVLRPLDSSSISGNAPPTRGWELPRTPPPNAMSKGDVPSTKDQELPRPPDSASSSASAPPTRVWELPRTPSPNAMSKGDVPSTKDQELPRPSDFSANAPLTRGWELPRTPPSVSSNGDLSSAKIQNLPYQLDSTSSSDNAPPTKTKELPCTPSDYPAQSSTTTCNVECVQIETKNLVSSPSRVRVPRHPLSYSNRASPIKQPHPPPPASKQPHFPAAPSKQPHPPLASSTQQSNPPDAFKQHHTPAAPLTKQQHPPASTSQQPHSPAASKQFCPPNTAPRLGSLREAKPSKSHSEHHEIQASPPITTSSNISSLSGLKCTEEDIAFLQRMDYLKQYQALQAENKQLSKVGKTMAEEKELLEHTALKVKSDLEEMKTRYQETVSAMNALIANTDLLPLAHGVRGDDPPPTSSSQGELNEASVFKLKKLNQLTSAQEEKTTAKLRARLQELDKTKQELQERIKLAEEIESKKKAELLSSMKTTADEKQFFEGKIRAVSDESASARAEMESLQAELAKLEVTSSTVTEKRKPAVRSKADEKQQTEERLKRLIQRCDMYVRRQQMLKEMGISIRYDT